MPRSPRILMLADCLDSSAKSGGFDLIRTVRFAVVGLTCHGPFFFAGFGWVDRLFGSPLGAGGSVMWKVLAKKVLTTQLILNPPYMVILFAWMGFLGSYICVSTTVHYTTDADVKCLFRTQRGDVPSAQL